MRPQIHSWTTPWFAMQVAKASRWLANQVSKAQDVMEQERQERLSRKGIEAMRGIDPHILKDIGLTRYDVDYVLTLPLSANAHTELAQLRRHNKQSGI